MRSSSFLLGLLFSSFLSFGQVTVVDSEAAVSSYFKLPRETVYLHLNKSTYVVQDEIWFKGYVHDRKNGLPSLASTNFNIEVFDDQGTEKYSGLFLGYQGVTLGNIAIGSDWKSGDYYVRISTNWMNNFIEDDSFTSKIRIINGALSVDATSVEDSYDFQLLPEGGHLVSEVDNTVGFKLLDSQGRGKSFYEGFIVDAQGSKLVSFTSNSLGLGKFRFRPVLGMQYSAKVILGDGKELSIPIKDIKGSGISMQVDSRNRDHISVVLNRTSSPSVSGDYYVLVHQNDKTNKVALVFDDKELSKTLTIARNRLFSGVNTLTLFREQTPLLERLIFNGTDKIEDDIRVTKLNSKRDSLIMSINVPKNDVVYDLSVSVLPEGSKSYAPHDNIISAMLLRPYVKGVIEQGGYYFRDQDEIKLSDLDLLLLTQGWSRYHWNNIKNKEPKVLYDFNRGLVLRGRVQNTRVSKIDKVYLFPFENNPGSVIDLDPNDNSFVVNTLFLKKNEKLRFSTIRSNGSMARTNMYLKVQTNRFKKPFETNLLDTSIKKRLSMPDLTEIVDSFYNDDVEKLEKVIVKGAKKKEEFNDAFISDNVKRNARKISKQDTQDFPNILDYIATKGFRVKYGYHINTTEYVTILPINGVTFNGSGVAVYVDDFRLSNFNLLLDMQTADIDQILVDKRGSITGLNGAGTILIYTRKVPLEGFGKQKESSYITEYSLDKGFESIKEFYTPKYLNYSSPGFKNYGTIHWEAQLQPDKNGSALFKIPDTGLEGVTFYIEGMGSDGTLISKIQTIQNKNSN
ncbi:hypothetical protein D1816_16300 [Aquimarina sp. AD10]|uniref:hypothetical protein n=1 Tax=Aquimarina sp. AD10 TaxID=1714849 RepID=UPI000E4C904F|nr:hypothetical protein [Aquimarina sp. AD10]AXT61851.1 hypothetical protein D1816_16300 [Aquimarina sp. AD10]